MQVDDASAVPRPALRLAREIGQSEGVGGLYKGWRSLVAALMALNRLCEAEEVLEAILARDPAHADAVTKSVAGDGNTGGANGQIKFSTAESKFLSKSFSRDCKGSFISEDVHPIYPTLGSATQDLNSFYFMPSFFIC